MNISLSMLFKKQYCGACQTLVFVLIMSFFFIKSIFFLFPKLHDIMQPFPCSKKKRICLETNYVYLKYYIIEIVFLLL